MVKIYVTPNSKVNRDLQKSKGAREGWQFFFSAGFSGSTTALFRRIFSWGIFMTSPVGKAFFWDAIHPWSFLNFCEPSKGFFQGLYVLKWRGILERHPKPPLFVGWKNDTSFDQCLKLFKVVLCCSKNMSSCHRATKTQKVQVDQTLPRLSLRPMDHPSSFVYTPAIAATISFGEYVPSILLKCPRKLVKV